VRCKELGHKKPLLKGLSLARNGPKLPAVAEIEDSAGLLAGRSCHPAAVLRKCEYGERGNSPPIAATMGYIQRSEGNSRCKNSSAATVRLMTPVARKSR
jgi:hypothetical protein